MALGGVTESIRYVLESDQGRSLDVQTVFWVHQRSPHEINKLAARISNMSTSRTGRKKDMRAEDLEQIDREQWGQIVEKVENFFVSISAPQEILDHFSLEADSDMVVFTLNKQELKFHRVKEVTADDEVGLQHIRQLLTSAEVAEVVNFSDSIGMLTEEEKKS